MAEGTLVDVANASGNPGIYGGFMAAPTEELTFRQVADLTAGAPAVVGKVLGKQYLSTNTGGQNFVQAAVANAGFKPGSVGIVKIAAPALNGNARIQTKGVTLALVESTSNANKAINPGDPLCVDAAGNLTSAPAAPIAGTVVAIYMGVTQNSAAAALALVDLGGTY